MTDPRPGTIQAQVLNVLRDAVGNPHTRDSEGWLAPHGIAFALGITAAQVTRAAEGLRRRGIPIRRVRDRFGVEYCFGKGCDYDHGRIATPVGLRLWFRRPNGKWHRGRITAAGSDGKRVCQCDGCGWYGSEWRYEMQMQETLELEWPDEICGRLMG